MLKLQASTLKEEELVRLKSSDLGFQSEAGRGDSSENQKVRWGSSFFSRRGRQERLENHIGEIHFVT